MTSIDIARRLNQLGQTDEALNAYQLALNENNGADPAVDYEAACFIFFSGGNYRVAYSCFKNLYDAGYYRDKLLPLMTNAFYAPNEKLLRTRYEKNCKLLGKYPYLFRRDFPPFEELPIQFFPYDDNGFIPFYRQEQRFGDYVNFNDTVVSRNFFKDLEKPILARDVYSQYELEYLNDNVRKSEYVARENHIYLHYTDWGTFCSHLQCMNFRKLLEGKKFVFLIGEEIQRYPIDFKEEFGIDYSQYSVKPVGIREINKLIWHTQLSTDNGGDFFNEIFDSHPNLLFQFSVMYDSVEEKLIPNIREDLLGAETLSEAFKRAGSSWPARIVEELYNMRGATDKDILVAWFLSGNIYSKSLDVNARIVPAIFFQPHFANINYVFKEAKNGEVMLEGTQLQKIHKSGMFRFKYIKTFSPLRRFTTSYGAAVRTMLRTSREQERDDPDAETKLIVPDAVSQRACNRSFMRDPDDRLYRDSVIVRFEDGKLNPAATFSALAAFLDLPYTESMTYCSENGVRDVQTWANNAIGFDPVTVYRTYDEWANDSERAFLEYLLRDAYEFYGYDFHYYDGLPVDAERAKDMIRGFDKLDGFMRESYAKVYQPKVVKVGIEGLTAEERARLERNLDGLIMHKWQDRINYARIMKEDKPRFVNERRQPLRMIPLLKLDPAKLQQPLYH